MNFEEFNTHWLKIEKQLSPKYLIQPELRKFSPDLGLKLKRLGIGEDFDLVMLFTRLDMFAKVNDEMLIAGSNCDFTGEKHCVSFDFSTTMLNSILAGLPIPLRDQFVAALNRAPFHAMAGLVVEVDIVAQLGKETQGTYERFIPLVIKEVQASRFNPEPVLDDPKDVPSHIFQLRNAFKLK